MSYLINDTSRWAKSTLRLLILSIVLAGALSGCAAMEGVNVGASIPIGGIAGVGVNKTIGQSPPAPSSQTKPQEQETSETSEEE